MGFVAELALDLDELLDRVFSILCSAEGGGPRLRSSEIRLPSRRLLRSHQLPESQVAEFLASCDKYNITRGLYYTISNSHCKSVPGGGAPGNISCDDMLRNAFTELATKHGPIGQL